MTTLNFGMVNGLSGAERRKLQELAAVFEYHQSGNAVKDKYYEGHVTLNDVNLGIALPSGLRKIEVGCNWGQKAVDALASRSMFDGFVGSGAAAESDRGPHLHFGVTLDGDAVDPQAFLKG